MAKYEAVFIFDPTLVEGNGEAFGKTVEEQIQALGGTLGRIKCLDKRQFARPIGKHKAGIYWDYVVSAEGPFVAALKDLYRLNATVLRTAIFEFEDGHDDDVFTPRPEHDSLIKEGDFSEAFDEHLAAHGDR